MNSLIRKTLAIALCAWAVTASADNGVWTKRNTARKAIPAATDGTPLKRLTGAHALGRINTQPQAARSEAGTARAGIVTVISENFNKMTSGADGAPDLNTNIVGSDGVIYQDYVQTYGWAGINIFQAGGSCYLADGQTSLLATPVLDLSDNGGDFTVTVTFRAETEPCRFYIAAGNSSTIIGGGYVDATTEWGYVKIPLTDGTSQTMIQFSGTAPVYIDDITVTQTEEEEKPVTINAPENVSATNMSATGFTANWGAVIGATGYLLDVFSYGQDNTKTYVFTDKAVESTNYDVSGLEPGHIYFFSVQATDGTLISEESQQCIVKEPSESVGTPTAMEASEVTDEGFRANWSEAENAAWYTLYTYSYHPVTQNGILEVENETFGKITDGTTDNPLYNNLSQALNDCTVYPDWQGVTTMRADGMIGLRNYYAPLGVYSMLYSPIYMTQSESAPGKVTVRITAMRDADCSEATLIGVACVDADNQDTNVEWQQSQVTDIMQEYTFTFDGYKNYYIAIAYSDENNTGYTGQGTVWIDGINISQEMSAGDIFSRMHSCDVVFSGTSFFVPTPDRGNDEYSYLVQATTNGPESNIDSNLSNEIFVDRTTNGIDAVAGSGKVSVSGGEGRIVVTLDNAAEISVYNTAGTAVAGTDGKAGANEISLPCGMYIVKAAGTVTKVIVR